MKHLKMLGLAMAVAAALMAFAGPASATPILTSPAGVEYTGAIEATTNWSQLLKASVFNETCTAGTMAGSVTTNNTTSAGGAITFGISNCGSATVHVLSHGSISINNKGEVSGSGTQATWVTFGVSCVYGTTTNTPLGTLVGGNPAVLTIKASLPRIGGGFLCANPASFEGQYTVTDPKPLLLN